MAAAVGNTKSPDEMEQEKDVKPMPAADIPRDVIKHPLQNSWTLWYFENDRAKNWEDNQVEIYNFDTVEDFWALVNHIKPASEIRVGTDYSLFKKGVRPMWEDPANKNGGRWLVSLEKKQRGPELNNCWLEVMLCLIGEAFDEFSDDVCGAVMNIRPKGDKIGIWTGDGTRTNSIMEIGQRIKSRLNIPAKVLIGYQLHRDLTVKNSSVIKNRHQV
ncbi:Hypothetical predicted protein [Cloeon dipterum]|uniref:eIF-4F 25 kDa subunit n=1 Tax=Cloeon dipterum TaxID=197152 RepID=A0A8S1DE65_9INSE|nr:Hypothetical predicted protein [Cloeon dipterum]